jgi:hypothetical protein
MARIERLRHKIAIAPRDEAAIGESDVRAYMLDRDILFSIQGGKMDHIVVTASPCWCIQKKEVLAVRQEVRPAMAPEISQV